MNHYMIGWFVENVLWDTNVLLSLTHRYNVLQVPTQLMLKG